jgi:hypothetical protein
LWRGKSDKPAPLAPEKSDTLAIGEGIEDGLTAALAVPEMRIWCAYSLGNLGNIIFPKCVERWIVLCDNDWGKPQAEKQLANSLEKLKAQGLPGFEARSPVGKDFNDLLRSRQAHHTSRHAHPARRSPPRPSIHPERLQPREGAADYLRRHGYHVHADVSPEALKNLAFQQDLLVKQRLEEAAC